MASRGMIWAFSFLLAFSMLAGVLVLVPQNAKADPINVVINSGSDDRGLLIQDGSTFADARDRTTCTVYDWGNLGNGLHNSESGAGVFFLYRAAIYFNLTSIPADATIVDATVSVYILTTSFVDNPAQVGMSVCPGESGYPSARPPAAGDYAKAHIAAPADSVTSFSDGAFAEFTIPVEDITPNAWNAFYLRTKGDVDNTAPSGLAAYNQIQLFLGTATDVGNRPMIEIDYTPGPSPEPEPWAPTLNSITPFGSSNSSYADWVVGDDFDTGLIYNESCEYLLYTDAPFLIFGGDNGTEYCDIVNNSALVAGSYYAHVEATSDSGTLSLWTNWTFDVWPATVPDAWAPTFTNSAGTTGTIGVLYSYSPTCNESVTYSLETFPDWAIMDDGEISGTPLAAGDYSFELKATSDGGGLDAWQNWTVNVPEPIIIPDPGFFDPLYAVLGFLIVILLLGALMKATRD